jgi:hypothetical protein
MVREAASVTTRARGQAAQGSVGGWESSECVAEREEGTWVLQGSCRAESAVDGRGRMGDPRAQGQELAPPRVFPAAPRRR